MSDDWNELEDGDQFEIEDFLDFDMEPPHLYIAGPMRGIAYFNTPAFFEAEAMLTLRGYTVFNPAQRDVEEGLDHKKCPNGSAQELKDHGFSLGGALAFDLSYVCEKADGIVLLPGWQLSRGAVAELAACQAVGKPAYVYDAEMRDIEPLELGGPAICAVCESDLSASLTRRTLILISSIVVLNTKRVIRWLARRTRRSS
jgi:hypothetical protein